MTLSAVSTVERSIHGLGYEITLHEQRLIYLAIYKSRFNDLDLNCRIEISADEYSKAYQTSNKSTVNAMESIILNRWATKVEFLSNVQKIYFIFSSKGLAFVNFVNERLTDEMLSDIMSLNNRQAIRIYELMFAWFDGEIPYLNLTQFRKLTGLIFTNKGVTPSSFKSTLKTAFADIQQNTKNIFQIKQNKPENSKETYFSVVCA